MRIAIAGTGKLGTSLLRALLQKSSHEIVAVVQDGRKARGALRRVLPVAGRFLGGPYHMAGRAWEHGIPIVWIDRMTPEELAPLRALQPDLLLVGGFGIILKPPLLDLPHLGCVNTHSSLLPRHRGPNPFYAVILAGEKESGVTFHVMDEGIDTGPILDQTPFPVLEEDGMFDVYARACDVAAARVVAVMDRIARDGVQGVPQDPDLATYDKKCSVAEVWVDWAKPAVEIHRMVRALSPSPMPRFRYKGRLVRVARTRLITKPCEALPGTVLSNRPLITVATGRGALCLHVAYANAPVPWIWPAPWCRPEVGEVLESGNPQERGILST